MISVCGGDTHTAQLSYTSSVCLSTYTQITLNIFYQHPQLFVTGKKLPVPQMHRLVCEDTGLICLLMEKMGGLSKVSQTEHVKFRQDWQCTCAYILYM